ncbi:flavodoxin family protein [Marinomonas spartinae]|uniref:flavodoxin family protein n=1 Tax=Marinomonas spartinae TaxID=1792290 RepID=UPI0018F23E94|nr:flavodoxin family protein [Marinomonas spartinae]MBJ7554327.1 flavodoxin family protein [Marinomonas spartinae]
MADVALIYFSKTDITATLMSAAQRAIELAGLSTFSYCIQGTDIIEGRFIKASVLDELSLCRAVIFGSPTYMGNASAQFKAFADATSVFWTNQSLSGKLAAGITSGTGLNGDQTNTLQYFSTLSSQHGMLWVGLDASYGETMDVNRLGCQLGVVAQSTNGTVHPQDLLSAEFLAHRMANLTKRFV